MQIRKKLTARSMEHDWTEQYKQVHGRSISHMTAIFEDCGLQAIRIQDFAVLQGTACLGCMFCYSSTAAIQSGRLLQKKTIFHQKKECCAGALEGTFLRALTRLTHAKTVLEVGMFTGTTTLAIADALPHDGKVSVTLLVLVLFSSSAENMDVLLHAACIMHQQAWI